ncbi:MAG TPA: hypothetical protein VLX28_27555 [Thermoanaerobaculia bacterium]|nr:hypothetical protein [Thermoanaerobaculia bacterium]
MSRTTPWFKRAIHICPAAQGWPAWRLASASAWVWKSRAAE